MGLLWLTLCGNTAIKRKVSRNLPRVVHGGAMKAAVIHGVGDLRIEKMPVPEPGPGEVRLKLCYAGVCGSDIHYYRSGRVGVSVMREPMVPGHEVSAVVDAVGAGVTGLCTGQAVTVNPTTECCSCEFCLTGHQNLCPSLRYLGSAAKMPHTQGVMREYSVVPARQCIPLPGGMDMQIAACVEPLGIALHATSFAGNLTGARIFVSGAGPIGCLLAAVASFGGAREVVISDIQAFPLQTALKLGATKTVDARDADALAALESTCHVCFEASGSLQGMESAQRAVRPAGKLIHVGYLPEESVPYPINRMLLQKEVAAMGSQRAYHEFRTAVSLLAAGRLDIRPLVTSVYPLERTEEAILAATDKTRSMKVLVQGPGAA